MKTLLLIITILYKLITFLKSYLALCYAGLKKEHMKGSLKNLNLSGVILYRRDEHVVCTVHEKQLDLPNGGFKCVSALTVNEKCAFVCDRELRSITQFEIKTGNVLNTVNMEGEPGSISVNSNYLLLCDTKNSFLYLYDVTEGLTLLNSICVKNIDQLNGNNGGLSAFITEDDLIFVRNAESQLTLIDVNFEFRAHFSEFQAKLSSVTYVRGEANKNHMLIVGGSNGAAGKQQIFKLYAYAITLK